VATTCCFAKSYASLFLFILLLIVFLVYLIYISTEDNYLKFTLLGVLVPFIVLVCYLVIGFLFFSPMVTLLVSKCILVLKARYSKFILTILIFLLNEFTNFLGCGTLYFDIYKKMLRRNEIIIRTVCYPILRIF
jgi:hypothetical protein